VADDFLDREINRPNGISSVHRFSDFRGELEKWNDLMPPVPPGLGNHRIFCVPHPDELLQDPGSQFPQKEQGRCFSGPQLSPSGHSQHSVTISAGPQIQITPEIRVMGNSVVQLAQNVGSAVGLAVFTSVIGAQGVENGIGTAFIIAAATATAALVFGLFLKPLEEKAAT
jgi:hypothetical protein